MESSEGFDRIADPLRLSALARATKVNLDNSRRGWIDGCLVALRLSRVADCGRLEEVTLGFALEAMRRVLSRRQYVTSVDSFLQSVGVLEGSTCDNASATGFSEALAESWEDWEEMVPAFAREVAGRILGRRPEEQELRHVWSRVHMLIFAPQIALALAFDDMAEVGRLSLAVDDYVRRHAGG
jgi:hypothetical protein